MSTTPTAPTAAGFDEERLQKLADRLDADYPESWIPSDPGDQVIGTFVKLDKGRTSYGPAHIVVLEVSPGVFASVWLLHTVLRNEFNRARPVPGELVAVRYEGKKIAADGKTQYDAYRVAVDRESEAANWDDLGPVDVEADTTPAAADDDFPAAPADDDVPF